MWRKLRKFLISRPTQKKKKKDKEISPYGKKTKEWNLESQKNNTVKVNNQPTTTTKTHFPTDFSKLLKKMSVGILNM